MLEIGVRDIVTADIKTAPGFAQRVRDQRIVELAQAMRSMGKPQPPLVRLVDLRLVAGEDRLAAVVVLGETMVRCRVVECSDQEIEATRRVEAANRSGDYHEQAAAITELLDMVEAEVNAERRANPDWAAGSRHPPTARGEARRRVSATIGKSVQALAKHDSRGRQGLLPKPREPKTEWQLEAYGFDAPATVQARAAAVRKAMEAADGHARSIQRAMSDVSDVYPPSTTVHELARRGAAVARALLPSHLCPWCKGHDVAMPHCAGCLGHGFVGRPDFERADEMLRTERVISYAGRYVNLDTLRALNEPRDTIPAASFVDEESFEVEEEPPADPDWERRYENYEPFPELDVGDHEEPM